MKFTFSVRNDCVLRSYVLLILWTNEQEIAENRKLYERLLQAEKEKMKILQN